MSQGILDPEEEFWDELAVECGFSPLAATTREEFSRLVTSLISQLETHKNKIDKLQKIDHHPRNVP